MATSEVKMTDSIHILSLGAGVQSSCLALMAAKGKVGPMPTAAIFADTHAEPESVYKWLDWLEIQLPFPVYRVSAGSLTEAVFKQRIHEKTKAIYYKNLIPAYTLNPDGTRGITGRACTKNHKLDPMFKKAKELGGIKRGQKTIGVISWIGISLDEVSRMKPSQLKWAQNRYPLIDMDMTRHDCLRWMEKNGYPKPPRSACTYCPFHSDNEWRRMKKEEPKEFAGAVEFEKKMQQLRTLENGPNRMKGKMFLHNSLKPLGEIDFSEDNTQGNFHFQNECEGMCGV
jgi:hypothetical protein